MLSPLQLKQHSLLEISLKEREGSPTDVSSSWIPGEPVVKADFASAKDDDYQSRIILTVHSSKVAKENTEAAWEFSLRIVGYFEFTDRAVPVEQAKRLALVNGSSILYGIARDLLHGLSLRGQKRSILLPSLNFAPWADNIKSEPAPAQLEAQEPATESVKKAAKKPAAKGKAKS